MNDLHFTKSELNGGIRMFQIITSLLDNDLYKLSMGQAIYHQFPSYTTEWSFKCRNKDVKFTAEMVEEIKRQIKMYCGLTYTEEELDYLRTIPWIKEDYINFLRIWHPRYEDFYIGDDSECGLVIKTNGTWVNTSQYEIPTLAIVNEVYFRMAYDYDELAKDYQFRTREKLSLLVNGFEPIGVFSEFGTRRRLSFEMQDWLLQIIVDSEIGIEEGFVGTSNVYFAMKYNLKPVGTMAHEWIMCVGQGNFKHNPAYSNWYALDAWVKEYGILNGTALTDTIGTDVFLKDFQLTFATLFSGVRHDSGDPIEWGYKILKHYEGLGIDPHTKTLLFSDSLDFTRANKIYEEFCGKCKVAFGIGTYLTNDTKVGPLNIVMKVTECNGSDVAKLSDAAGKGMCKSEEYIEHLKEQIKWRMKK